MAAGISTPQSLYYSGNHFKLKLGGNVSNFTGLENGQIFAPFAIDAQPVISFTNDSGNILLNIEIRDESENVIFSVKNSELTYSVGSRDVEWVGQTLTIRERVRRILLELEFSPPNMVSINRGYIQFNGIEIEIGKDFIFCLNNRMFISNCSIHVSGYGFVIGDPTPKGSCGIVVSGVPRPVEDRLAAKRYLRESLKKKRREKREWRLKEEYLQPISTRGRLMFSSAAIGYLEKLRLQI